MVRSLFLLSLLGCGGPNEETLVSELRVMAVVVEPPEVAPGESVQITPVVLDPAAEGFETLVWTCTRLGPECLENELPLEVWATVTTGTTARTIPAELSAALSEDLQEIPVSTWVLSCEVGLCPLFEAVQDPPEAGTDAYLALLADLADPTRWMDSLPQTGVSLGTKSFIVSQRPVEERNENPVPVLTEPLPEVGQESRIVLHFEVEDQQSETPAAYGYATGGGFEFTAYDVEAGAVDLAWVAPAEAGNVLLRVVFADGLGGNAVWEGDVSVE